ncbi:hypothetical protein IMG5_118660 [Ichthyophthirius multifiliis]|uniref:Uncharacterized protein n=1 Tax=Ichthyophthirius multifiliis TaxID=5932 RepID=G0QUQ6_ICHMU|nr:hypothetical protein IMG5_118660 [Ichthyophthirius multifiliis]EGR31041.1 hypothetical protein IMG5_118660 [Ichthyophthirius multifiliis]|eukprot:XP_004034527.1 hypothetical protein IMG5_118660 [Ichthyophthirius multifiliis]
MVIDLGKDIKIKGVDFSRICQNEKLFEKWFMSFIDYQFETLIAHLIKKNEETMVQEVCLRYWFFLIKFKKNQIKALYQNKVMTTLIKNKNTFFSTVERSLTNLIENRLKERDKAYSYSYNQKDRSNAFNNIKFEKMVLSESSKDVLKKFLGNLIKQKIELIEKMIKGYTSINIMKSDIINLLEKITNVENGMQQMIQEHNENIYFMKMYALIKSFIVFDPITTRKIENDLQDLYNKDKTVDSNTITSLTVLSGNVGSVIASFKSEKDSGIILKYSERIPQIFGYQRGEFQLKNKVVDLIPDCIAVLHDSFLQRLIQTGIAKTVRSYRTMFAKNSNGFIFLCKLFINYYFLIQEDFVFSAMIIKVQTQSHFIILNDSGYIEDLSQGFVEIMGATGIDISYLKQCHIGIFIPQFLDFIENYNPKEDYAFLKFRTDFPQDINNFVTQFLNHHKSFYKKWNVDRNTWKINLNTFIKGRRANCQSFESVINIKIEEFEGIKQTVRLFIVEVEKLLPWDEVNMSLSMSKRILVVIARMTDDEAENIVIGLQFIIQQLNSINDDYLHIDFSNYNNREEQINQSNQGQQKKSKKQRKNNYLAERIGNLQINFNTFFYILMFLCLLSTGFFLSVFGFMQQFPNTFGPPQERYRKYLESSLQLSTLFSTHNVILLNQYFTLINNGVSIIQENKQQELKNLRDDLLLITSQFFTFDYIDISLEGSGESFKQIIYEINTGNTCDQKYFRQQHRDICIENLQGLFKRGLTNYYQKIK